MTKKGTRAEINTFVQGIITEANPLKFPPNASLDEENFELQVDGSRDRRLGMDFEDGYQLVPTGESLSTINVNSMNTFKWYSVGGIPNKEFLVTQVNKKIFFFDLAAPTISDVGYLGTLTLSSFPANVKYSFTDLEGRLIVAAGVGQIAVISFDINTNLFTSEYQRIKVRDIWGVSESPDNTESDVSLRPSTLTDKHHYNLRNQSWGIPRKSDAGTLSDPISLYNTELSLYPSNGETVWPGLQFQPVASGQTPFERIYPNLYEEVLGADLKAPKGYFIIDLLERGESRSDMWDENKVKYPVLSGGVISLPSDYTPKGATCVADFAGRAWFGGFSGQVGDGDDRSPTLSNFIAFSQLVKSPSDITKCYQEGDPTSRENNEIVDTDGGVLRISEANNIVAMRSMGSNLIVIALNGVWAISGGDNNGFSATNYKVTKISSYGGLSESSVIVEGGSLYYWAEDGIYVVGSDQMGDLQVNNITTDTINTLYGGIPLSSKVNCIGSYDIFTKSIRWVYKEGEIFTSAAVTKELILDLRLKAFYISRVMNTIDRKVEVIGSFPSSSTIVSGLLENVFVGSDPVYVNSLQVNSLSTVRASGSVSLKYIVMVADTDNDVAVLTFSYYKNPKFIDWEAWDGIGADAKAFLVTGTATADDTSVHKQIPYLVMHFRRTEVFTENFLPLNESGCLVRSQWDWANTQNSRKWSPLFQAYRYRRPLFINTQQGSYDNGFETVVSRNKIRGRGRAFAFYMETEPTKDCRILGWSLTINGNSIA